MGIADSNPQKWVPVDENTSSRRGIDVAHSKIHDGAHFTCSYSNALSAGSVLTMAITAPATAAGYLHFVAAVQSNLSGTLVFTKGASLSVGSSLTIWNNNLNSATTSGAAIVGNPTITTVGTTISTVYIGTADKQTPIGGAAETRNEYILNPGSVYTIYFTANATSTFTSINAAFYVSS